MINSNSYRYERKFFIHGIDAKTVESFVYQMSMGFKEIYSKRWVNNIYFDYLDFKNFMDNIEGNEHRIKYRLRWYGRLFDEVPDAKLELKIKKGLVGTKRLIDLGKFQLLRGMSAAGLMKAVTEGPVNIDPDLKFKLIEQFPVMMNQYQRKYFQTFDQNFRITIDNHQSFYKFNKFNNNFLHKVDDSYNTILEIKYNKDSEKQVAEVTNSFPFRITKSSKYARGIELLYC